MTSMLYLSTTLVTALNGFVFEGKNLWRLAEGLNHVRVELTFQLRRPGSQLTDPGRFEKAGTMSTRLPCCFRVFYDYPSWRTGGSPFVPQVPGYLNTHIIHSFLTILNYKTVCACRSSIMDIHIPPIPNQPKTFKFPQRFFGHKNPVKRIVRK